MSDGAAEEQETVPRGTCPSSPPALSIRTRSLSRWIPRVSSACVVVAPVEMGRAPALPTVLDLRGVH